MSSMKSIAILTDNLRNAFDHMGRDPAVTELRHTSMRGKMHVLGVEREFIIVADAERMRGWDIVGFMIIGNPSQLLVETARYCVRS